MQTIIYLIRHTESEKNSKTINENLLLTHFGESCAEKLSKCEELKNIDVIFSSTYMRAKETAEYIAYENNIELRSVSAFDERKIGSREFVIENWKGKPYSYTTGQLLDEDLKDEGGESAKEVRERFTKAFNDILKANSGSRVVIVSHAAAIKYFLMNYCTLDSSYNLIYNGKKLIGKKLDYPEFIKFVFNGSKVIDITCESCE
ncbi:MAG: histidine phosphatase family protein [Clostridia bacterium]|nr:histidine phosphatase family protein [Clostridia bacterium]